MAKFKVVLTYEHKEVFEVYADNEQEAFEVATCCTPDEIWDCSLIDSDVYEVE